VTITHWRRLLPAASFGLGAAYVLAFVAIALPAIG